MVVIFLSNEKYIIRGETYNISHDNAYEQVRTFPECALNVLELYHRDKEMFS